MPLIYMQARLGRWCMAALGCRVYQKGGAVLVECGIWSRYTRKGEVTLLRSDLYLGSLAAWGAVSGLLLIAGVCGRRPLFVVVAFAIALRVIWRQLRFASRVRRCRNQVRGQLPLLLCCLSAGFRAGSGAAELCAIAAKGTTSAMAHSWVRARQRCDFGAGLAAQLQRLGTVAEMSQLQHLAVRVEQARLLGEDAGELVAAAAVQAGTAQAIELRERAGRVAALAGLISALVLAPAAVLLIAVGVAGELFASGPL